MTRNLARLALAALLALHAACGSPSEPAADLDAGVEAAPDAALADAGRPDAGEVPDAGIAPDAGLLPDAGIAPDAGCVLPEGNLANPAGYPLDGWAWEKRGLVLEAAQAAAGDGFIAPTVVEANGGLHLFFVQKTGLEHRILHAGSADGAAWSAPEPVTGLGEDPVQSAPSVLFEGGRFRMWFTSGGIDLAESDDGVVWTVTARGVLGVGEAPAFDSLSVLYPSVVAEAGGYAMLYTGFDGSRYAVGRAVSADGVSWLREPAGAVLARGGAGAFDNAAVAQPAVVRSGAGRLMWFAGYDTSLTNPGPYRVGLARSDDGVAWQKAGVSLELSADGLDAYSTRGPAPFVWQGRWRMIYVGMGTDYRYRLLGAESAVCVP